MQDLLKTLEHKGRCFLGSAVSFLFTFLKKKKTLQCPPSSVLIVRLDERVGNTLLLTPMLATVKKNFPTTHTTVLGHIKSGDFLKNHPDVDIFIPFNKRSLFGTHGVLQTLLLLRKQRYALAIDASNPTHPSFTHAFYTLLSSSQYTVGSSFSSCASVFDKAIAIRPNQHEIDLRLQLLEPLRTPAYHTTRTMRICSAHMASPFQKPYRILNVGARLAEKRLSAQQYAHIASVITQSSMPAYLTYGPSEEGLAQEIVALCPHIQKAPPTDLSLLHAVFAEAECVVSCDTGPMHLATATGTPTFGIFVSTDPKRYGHTTPPHNAFDLRTHSFEELVENIKLWLVNPSRTPSSL